MAENELSDKGEKFFRKIKLISTVFAPLCKWQDILYDKKIRAIQFDDRPPVFVLGHWRSGTTHLHYLLSLSEQFAYLENFQAFFFKVAQISGPVLKPFLSAMMPRKRPQDNIHINANSPAEEEQPFANISHRTGMQSFFFPKNKQYFNKYNLFLNTSEEELEAWKKDFIFLLQNIAFYTGNKKTLLLKNPHNTSRIKELLSIFPKARFIHIHRDPFEVFNSSVHLYRKTVSTQFLQDFSEREIEETVLYNYEKTMGKFIQERALIPDGQFFEMSYEGLKLEPIETLSKVFEHFDWSGLDEYKIAAQKYLNGLGEYEANKFEELNATQRSQILDRWEFAFDHFGYGKR